MSRKSRVVRTFRYLKYKHRHEAKAEKIMRKRVAASPILSKGTIVADHNSHEWVWLILLK